MLPLKSVTLCDTNNVSTLKFHLKELSVGEKVFGVVVCLNCKGTNGWMTDSEAVFNRGLLGTTCVTAFCGFVCVSLEPVNSEGQCLGEQDCHKFQHLL